MQLWESTLCDVTEGSNTTFYCVINDTPSQMLALPSEPLVCFSFQTHAGSNRTSVLVGDCRHRAK